MTDGAFRPTWAAPSIESVILHPPAVGRGSPPALRHQKNRTDSSDVSDALELSGRLRLRRIDGRLYAREKSRGSPPGLKIQAAIQ